MNIESLKSTFLVNISLTLDYILILKLNFFRLVSEDNFNPADYYFIFNSLDFSFTSSLHSSIKTKVKGRGRGVPNK